MADDDFDFLDDDLPEVAFRAEVAHPEEADTTELPVSAQVAFSIPIPAVEQVTAEIARQLVAAYSKRYYASELVQDLSGKINAEIDRQIGERVGPVISALLDKPMQPTDGFGNPVGEKTSLAGLIASRIETWAETTVDRDGTPKKSDYYTKYQTRIARAIGDTVDAELNKQVKAEVDKIKAQLKASATQAIAKQIADQVSGMVLK